jgi:DNA-binding transcriptional MocR family regulator
VVEAEHLITGTRAGEIVTSVDALVQSGSLRAGDPLPTVRRLAERLSLSPTTVAAAYRELQARGLVASEGRRGTRVARRPATFVSRRGHAAVPAGVRDLTSGNPDPELLPDLEAVLHRLELPRRLYNEPTNRSDLLGLAAGRFRADGISPDFLAVTGGALDGIERVLAARLRPGDRVVLEDPGYPALIDLVGALGLLAVPVEVDDLGPRPEELERALSTPAAALVLTPRAQNPFGSALDERRRRELERLLRKWPELLVVEDDHAASVSGAAALTLTAERERWAVVRSVAKALGPDLRLAVVAGDGGTISRLEARQQLGTGWVSHILQRAVVELWRDPATERATDAAREAYAQRRQALTDALGELGVEAHGRSGLNVWVPVEDEAAAIARLLSAGWAVNPGEHYRFRTGPAVRVTISTLLPAEAPALAAALAAPGEAPSRTRSA